MTIKSTVLGLRQLDNALQQFPEQVQRREANNAARAMARPIRKEIASRAPRGITGRLFRSVVVRARRGVPGWALIGFLKPTSRRVHLAEFGTRYAAATPFVRPGLQAARSAAIARGAAALARGIERQAKRLYQPQLGRGR